MLYEIRVYEPVPGKEHAVHEAFERFLPIAKKHGVIPVGIFDAPLEKESNMGGRRAAEHPDAKIGQDKKYIIYILKYKDVADRNKAWDAFRGDPEVAKIAKEIREKVGGPYEAGITNYLITPAKYSPLQ